MKVKKEMLICEICGREYKYISYRRWNLKQYHNWNCYKVCMAIQQVQYFQDKLKLAKEKLKQVKKNVKRCKNE